MLGKIHILFLIISQILISIKPEISVSCLTAPFSVIYNYGCLATTINLIYLKSLHSSPFLPSLLSML